MRLAESGPLPRLLARSAKLEERESFNARTEWPTLPADVLLRRILEAVAVLFEANARISMLRPRFL